jgi:SAM-dependent methyltransferase
MEAMIEGLVAYLSRIGEERPEVFDRGIHERLGRLDAASKEAPEERPALMARFFEAAAPELDRSVLHRHIRQKPLGYAGDYLAIEGIYQERCDEEPASALWDRFFHRQCAPRAVRNRKQYFRDLFAGLCRERPEGASILNVASGPCRDLAEAIEQAGEVARGSRVHCVDIDARAVEYARAIVPADGHGVEVRFEVKNALRLRPLQRYDLVWSAGLFDYLEDRAAVRLLARMWSWTAQGGRLVVGNFHPANPSRPWMEWGGAWFLVHRAEEDYLRLCEAAGIPLQRVTFEREPLGVCLFCCAAR